MNVVKYSWVERGGKGFVEMNFFCGDPDNPDLHTFYLDHDQAMSLAVELGNALPAGLGKVLPQAKTAGETSREQLMEREIALHFSGTEIILSRPCECRAIAREGAEVQVVSVTGQRAFIWCASEAVAERVLENLRNNKLADLHLDDDIVKMIIHAGDEVYAAGLSAVEADEMGRDYERTALDCWQRQTNVRSGGLRRSIGRKQ